MSALAAIPVLLGTAVLLLLTAPVALTRGTWQVRAPRLTFYGWFGALGLGCLCIVAAVVIGMIATISLESIGVGGLEGAAIAILSWLTLGLVGGAGAYVLTSAEPLIAEGREVRLLKTAIARGRERRSGFELIRFRADDPVVCAVAGSEPAIWISDGAERLLSRPELHAVLAHEYAHLRLRHHWAKRIATLNAACLPRKLRAGPALAEATNLLIELIADDAAARQAGPAYLANALVTLGRATANPGMGLRAERIAQRQWRTRRPRTLPRALREHAI